MNQSTHPDNSSPDNDPHNRPPTDEGPAEPLDSVPDSEQENPGLDPQTQSLMDSMVDEEFDFEVVREDASDARKNQHHVQPDRLEQLASASREIQTPQADVEDKWRDDSPVPDEQVREVSDGVPDHLQEQPMMTGNAVHVDHDDLLPESYMYVVQAALPDAVLDMVDAALAHIQMDAPIEGLQLQAAFLTQDILSASQVLDQWAREYLPLSTGLTHVHSEVRGSQHYVAGWRLDNVSDWHEAQNDLTTRLAGHIAPAPNAQATFRAIVGLLPATPATEFPHLVTFLQENFEPLAFDVEAIQLYRQPQPQFAHKLPPERRGWQLLSVFPLS